jgi:CheY-like chemotaxis protein
MLVNMDQGPLVFVVDDDAAIRETARMILEDEGYAAEVAGDGSAVLARLQRGPLPALILLDLTMPKMDGRELLVELEARPDLAAVPIVLMTASSATPETSALRYPLLRKPFGLELFMQVITTYCPRLWDDDEPPTQEDLLPLADGPSSSTSRDHCCVCGGAARTRCPGCGEAFCRACLDAGPDGHCARCWRAAHA